MSTSVLTGTDEMTMGYCKRWSVEVAFAESKGLLGFHDPCVWKKESVERTAPLAWFTGTIIILWYEKYRDNHPRVRRQQPWYNKSLITFAEM
jgi:hypothetical protein